MDEKKKILLGEKDIIAKDNEDLFVNISLNKTFAELRDDKFENEFDVEKQFRKERNASRSFRIYGIIDSNVSDSNALSIGVFSSETSTAMFFVQSTSLAYNEVNAYGKKRGKYLLELNNFPHDFVFLQIPANGTLYSAQTYVQQLVFKDSEGNFIDYGTQTTEIDANGNVSEINNDFYFLYNKHWIKKDLLIQRNR